MAELRRPYGGLGLSMNDAFQSLPPEPEIEQDTLDEIEAERRYLRRFMPFGPASPAGGPTRATDDWMKVASTQVTSRR